MKILDRQPAPDGVIFRVLVPHDELATYRALLGAPTGEAAPSAPLAPYVPLVERTKATAPRCPESVRQEIAARLKFHVEQDHGIDQKSLAAGEREESHG